MSTNKHLALVISAAQQIIANRFEHSGTDEEMAYHNNDHTYVVLGRATAIAEAMDLSEREIMLVQIGAAFHDTVQDWVESLQSSGIVKRKRNAGANEVASANEAFRAMTASELSFTPFETGLVPIAIMATIPGWSPEHGTVTQPFLHPTSHPVIRAVALADLGSAGMDPDCFVKDGIKLFAEEELDVMRRLRSAKRSSDIDQRTQDSYRARLVSWLSMQAGFARGRQALLDTELEGLREDQKERVADLFCHFDSSIERSKTAVIRAETEEFVPLMRQLLPMAFPEDA